MSSHIQNLKTLAKRHKYYVCAVVCLGLGVFLHWFLFLAFLCALKPLHEEIDRMRHQLLEVSGTGNNTIKPPESTGTKAAGTGTVPRQQTVSGGRYYIMQMFCLFN